MTSHEPRVWTEEDIALLPPNEQVVVRKRLAIRARRAAKRLRDAGASILDAKQDMGDQAVEGLVIAGVGGVPIEVAEEIAEAALQSKEHVS